MKLTLWPRPFVSASLGMSAHLSPNTASETTATKPYLGMIEGFYGQRYSQAERAAMCLASPTMSQTATLYITGDLDGASMGLKRLKTGIIT